MQRLVTSSTRAIKDTLEKRAAVLENPWALAGLPRESIMNEEWSDLDGQLQLDTLMSFRLETLKNEEREVKRLLALAQEAEISCPDAKAEALIRLCLLYTSFHNSKNSVWNAIQEGLWRAGFVVADVRTLDKQQGTFNQATAAGAVKKDLVISAYKPNEGLEERFKLKAGTQEGVWDFVRTHLKQLASVSSKEGVLEAQQERMDYMLYDRMVAFHVQRGIMVPMSAAEFYAGLEERFPKRDGMYFLPDQAAEYDRKKMQSKGLKQLDLFVRDEDSAILWVKQQLSRKPQTFQELHPQFTKESIAWVKFEKHVELADLLKENFLCYDGTGPIPNQIVSWLKCSEKYRDKINEIEAKHGLSLIHI